MSSLFLNVAIGLGSVSWAADFQKGLDAFARGDYATDLKEWTPFAEHGNELDQILLGLMYANGRGVPHDCQTAVQWYTLAAKAMYLRKGNDPSCRYQICRI